MDKKRLATIYAFKNLLRALQDSIDTDWRRIAKDLGLTVPQHHLLWIIHFKPGATLSQLSNYALWGTPTVMHVVDNLASKGYAVKYTDPRDTRLRRVYLTDEGEEMIKKAGDLAEGYRILDIFEQLGEEKLLGDMENLYYIAEKLQGSDYTEFIRNNAKKILGDNEE